MNTDSARQERGTYYEARIALALARSNAALAGGAGSVVVFRPGGVRAGNVYPTFPAAYAALAPGGRLVVDGSLVGGLCHTGTNLGKLDFEGIELAPWSNRINAAVGSFTFHTLVIDDGTQLEHVTQVLGFLALQLDSRTLAGLTYDYDPTTGDNLVLFEAAIVMAPTATIPGVSIPPGGTLTVIGFEAVFGQPGTQPVFHATGGNITLEGYSNCVIDPDACSTDVASTFLFFHDSSIAFLTFPGVLAAQTDGRTDMSQWVSPAYGSTAQRPVPPNVQKGQPFFDNSIAPAGVGRPIWFVGVSIAVPTGWVDATGTGA